MLFEILRILPKAFLLITCLRQKTALSRHHFCDRPFCHVTVEHASESRDRRLWLQILLKDRNVSGQLCGELSKESGEIKGRNSNKI